MKSDENLNQLTWPDRVFNFPFHKCAHWRFDTLWHDWTDFIYCCETEPKKERFNENPTALKIALGSVKIP